jgi:kynurenine formamidase
MAKRGRRTGWRKKDQRETLQISPYIEKSLVEWLRTQENQTRTIEKALIDYRKKMEAIKCLKH